jgi:pyridoxamine 5'-phosphate oxidase
VTDSTPYGELRVNYDGETLDISDVSPAPLTQFERWFDDVLAAKLPEPNAMVVATATIDGQPSARHVLLKQADARGFVFYSNYDSRKGQELAANPKASLVFPWFAMYRQVVVLGRVEKVSREESAEYFATRPHGSRIGASVSHQSEVLKSRDELDARWQALAEQHPDDVPLPDSWGGFVVIPESIEFWAGRRSRLHDRIQYVHDGSANVSMTDSSQWSIQRLSP